MATGALALVMAGVALLVAVGEQIRVQPGWSLLLAAMLLALSAHDARDQILPDVLTLPLAGLGLLQAVLSGHPSLLEALAGALLGYGIIWGLALVWRRWRGVEAIGMGDAKLLAAGGAWAGAGALAPILLVGSGAGLATALLGSVFRTGRLPAGLEQRIPFGPFLALGIWTGWCLLALRPA